MIQVACALIERDNKEFLLVQRSAAMSHPLQWEFPGGKIETGESAAAALGRELREELGVEVAMHTALKPLRWDYPGKQIVLYPIICELSGGLLQLHEHRDYRWLTLEQMGELPLLEADTAIINQLKTGHENSSS